jgi:hypothetical protein
VQGRNVIAALAAQGNANAAESRAALQLLSTAAVRSARQILAATSGAPEVARRYDLLGGVPEVIGYYAEGSAALAADFYEESRDAGWGYGPVHG